MKSKIGENLNYTILHYLTANLNLKVQIKLNYIKLMAIKKLA